MAKASSKKSASFVCELPLKVTSADEVVLLARLEAARQIYNACLSEALRRVNLVRQSSYFGQANKLKSDKAKRKSLFKQAKDKHSFSEYALHSYSTGLRQSWLDQHIDSNTTQKLATRAYQSVEKILFGKFKRVRFKGRNQMDSVEGKSNKTGIRWNGEGVEWSGVKLSCLQTKNDPVILHGLNSRVKYVRLVRRKIQGRNRFYAQLVCEGKPFIKPKNTLGKGVMGIPYVFAAYCPTVLPSPHHAPPVLAMLGDAPTPATADYRELWDQDARRWNDMWGPLLNWHRASLGLAPVNDVHSHILTDRPWLAADPTLAPWPDPADGTVFQTGAWILPDVRPLSAELEAFLDAGEPPVYFGFGSIRAPKDLSRVMIESARAIGGRAIVSHGWADLSLVDDEPDCLVIGEVNQQALFKRVAAVVHHGGAGTTTTAARAGAPQVVIPQHYDQHYWAQRIHHLGIGTAHAPGTPTTASLTSALERTLQPDVAARAESIATTVRSDGAQAAAQRLISGEPENSF